MLDEFGMLVARRAGEYQPPEEYQGKIRTLAMTGEWDELSATHVRERIASGGPWRHLVPASIVEIVEGVYGAISGGDRGDLR
jgi:nicotinic acid mononucleotide adenylyltransferase